MAKTVVEYNKLSEIDRNNELYKFLTDANRKVNEYHNMPATDQTKLGKQMWEDALQAGGKKLILDALGQMEVALNESGVKTKIIEKNNALQLVSYDDKGHAYIEFGIAMGTNGLIIQNELVTAEDLKYKQNAATGVSEVINPIVAYLTDWRSIYITRWAEQKAQKGHQRDAIRFAHSHAKENNPIKNQGGYKLIGDVQEGFEVLAKQKNLTGNQSKSFNVDPSGWTNDLIYKTTHQLTHGLKAGDKGWELKESEVRKVITKIVKTFQKLPYDQAVRIISQDPTMRKMMTFDETIGKQLAEMGRFFGNIKWNMSNMSEADASALIVSMFGDLSTGVPGIESNKRDQTPKYFKRKDPNKHNSYAHTKGAVRNSAHGNTTTASDYDTFAVAPIESEAITKGFETTLKDLEQEEEKKRQNVKKWGQSIKHKKELVDSIEQEIQELESLNIDEAQLIAERDARLDLIKTQYKKYHQTGDGQTDYGSAEAYYEHRKKVIENYYNRFINRSTTIENKKKHLEAIRNSTNESDYKKAADYHSIDQVSSRDWVIEKYLHKYHVDLDPNKPHGGVLDDEIIIAKEALAEIETQMLSQKVFSVKDFEEDFKNGKYKTDDEAVLDRINEERKKNHLTPITASDLRVARSEDNSNIIAQFTEDFIIREGSKLLDYVGKSRWSSSSLPIELIKNIAEAQAKMVAKVKAGTDNGKDYEDALAQERSRYFDDQGNLKIAGIAGIKGKVKGEKLVGYAQGLITYALGSIFNNNYDSTLTDPVQAQANASDAVHTAWNKAIDQLVADGKIKEHDAAMLKKLVVGTNAQGQVQWSEDSKVTKFVNKNISKYMMLVSQVYKDATGLDLGQYNKQTKQFEFDPYAVFDMGVAPSIVAEQDWDPNKRVSHNINEREIKEREIERLSAMGYDTTVDRKKLEKERELALENNPEYKKKVSEIETNIKKTFDNNRKELTDVEKQTTAMVDLETLNNENLLSIDDIREDDGSFDPEKFKKTAAGIVWQAQQAKYKELLKQEGGAKAVLAKYGIGSAKDIKVATTSDITGIARNEHTGIGHDAYTGNIIDLAGLEIETDENGNIRVVNASDVGFNRNIVNAYRTAQEQDDAVAQAEAFGKGVYDANLQRRKAYTDASEGSEFERYAKLPKSHSKFFKTKNLEGVEEGTAYMEMSEIIDLLAQREGEDDKGYSKILSTIYWQTVGQRMNRQKGESHADYGSRLKEGILDAVRNGKALVMDVSRDPQNTALAGVKAKIKYMAGIGKGVVGGDPAYIKFLKGDYDGDRLGIVFDIDGNVVSAVKMSQEEIDEWYLKQKAIEKDDAEVLSFLTNQGGDGTDLPIKSTAIKDGKIKPTTISKEELNNLKRGALSTILGFESKQNKDDFVGGFSNVRTGATAGLEHIFGKGLGATVNSAKIGLGTELVSLLLARPEQAAISSKHLQKLKQTERALYDEWFTENEKGEIIAKQAYLDRYQKLLDDLKNPERWNDKTSRGKLLKDMVHLGMIEGEGKFTDDQFFGEFFKLAKTDLGRQAMTELGYGNIFDEKGQLKKGADLSQFDLSFVEKFLDILADAAAEIKEGESLGHIITTGKQYALNKQKVDDLKDLLVSPTEQQEKAVKEKLGKDYEVEILRSINLLIDTIKESNGVISKAAGIGGSGEGHSYSISNIIDPKEREKIAHQALAGDMYLKHVSPTGIARQNAPSKDKPFTDWEGFIEALQSDEFTTEEKQEMIGRLTDYEKGNILATRRGKLAHQYSEDQELIEKYGLNNLDPEQWENHLREQLGLTSSRKEKSALKAFIDKLNKPSDALNNENGGFLTQFEEFRQLAKLIKFKDPNLLADIISSGKILNNMSRGKHIIARESGMNNYIMVNGEEYREHGYIDRITSEAFKKGQTDINGEKYETDGTLYTTEDIKTTYGGGTDLTLKDAIQVLRYVNAERQFNRQFREQLKGTNPLEMAQSKQVGAAKALEDFLSAPGNRKKYAEIRQMMKEAQEDGSWGDERVWEWGDANARFEGSIKKIDTKTGEAKSYRVGYREAIELVERMMNGEDISGYLNSFVEERQYSHAGLKNANLKEEVALLEKKYKLQLDIQRATNEGKKAEAEILQTQLQKVDAQLREEQIANNKLATTKQQKKELSKQRKEVSQGLDDQYALEYAKLTDKQKNPNIIERFSTGLLDGVSQRFNRMFSGYALIGKIAQGINKVKQEVVNLDKVVVSLRIVTQDDEASTRSLISTYADLAGQLGTTTSEISTMGQEWLRQGYSIAETTDLITASQELSVLGMMSSQEAVKDLTSAMKGFKIEASDAMDIVDRLTALDVEAATTAGEIADALSQFANVGSLGGLNIDQAAAMATTIMDVSQQSGSQAGNALKMMLSRFGNVKTSAYSSLNLSGDSETETATLNEVESVLNNIGVSVRSSNLEFRSFADVLDDINEKWFTLDNVSKNAIATAFAGKQALC